MNDSEIVTATLIEDTLQNSTAFKKIEDRLYVVKQGSAYVMINIIPLDNDRCVVSCVAQVVAGIAMTGELAQELLTRNASTRMGAFAYEPTGKLLLFRHTILGGQTLDADELLATLSDVALFADEVDDDLAKTYGGQRMEDILEEAALQRIVDVYAG